MGRLTHRENPGRWKGVIQILKEKLEDQRFRTFKKPSLRYNLYALGN